MEETTEPRACECGHPDRWVANRRIPVEFDARMNEYHLVRGGAKTLMRYCFWCGGRLPESKRGTFFTKPDEAEKAEIAMLLRDAKSHEDVLRILGPPDEIIDGGGCSKQRKTGKILWRWDQSYRYTTRWKSLVLDVPILLEGSFSYSIHGHYLGDPPAEE